MTRSVDRPRRARRALSQHFLVDPNLQRKIVAALEASPSDHVVEIGPGLGALTRHLAGQVARIVLVELDADLAEQLTAEYRGRNDVTVIHADVLDVSLSKSVRGRPFKVIGNIPYAITTPLIFHLLDQRPRPQVAVLTVQREVADRLLARPGTKNYGALTVGVQAVAGVERLFGISRNVFRPRPDVDSTAIRITPIDPPPLSESLGAALRELTRTAFSRRRKQLRTILRGAPNYDFDTEQAEAILSSLGVDPATRPDALPVEAFVRLAEVLQRRS